MFSHYNQIIMRTPTEQLYIDVGKRIAAYRKELKLTQNDLAEKIDISQKLIAAYEIGIRRVSLQTIIKIAEALHVELYDLLPDMKHKRRGPKPKILLAVEKIKTLDEKKQEAVLNLIDSFSNTAGKP